MEKRIISADLMKFMSMFESVTRVGLKDCFVDETTDVLTFIVPQGKIGKALGKGAANIKTMERKLNRRIKIVEYSDDVKTFIKSLLLPLRISDISEIDDRVFQIETQDRKSRGVILGRSASNLRSLEKVTRRFFDVKEIKVV